MFYFPFFKENWGEGEPKVVCKIRRKITVSKTEKQKLKRQSVRYINKSGKDQSNAKQIKEAGIKHFQGRE